jgi:hypothetical protein
MPWEWLTVRGILSLQRPNEYGERTVDSSGRSAIECTRQQGKTLIIVLLILFLMFVRPAVGRARVKHIVYTAQQWATASQVFDRVEAVILRVPYMKRQLIKNPSKRDNHGLIETRYCKVEFGPRTKHFARGYTEIDVVIIDEAYDVEPLHESNLTGSQSASPNPLTVYISTPPVKDEHPNAQALADLHRQGHRRARDLFYQLFAAPRHLSFDAPEAWELAQPSYGVATNEREVRSKCEKAKKSTRRRAIFLADYLGWGDYPPPEIEGSTEISAEKWAGMKAKAIPVLTGSPAVVLERESGGPWVITAASRTSAGPVLIEVGYCEAAASVTVVQRLITLVAAWDPCALVVRSGSDAAALAPELETALGTEGLEVTMANRTEVAQACGGFLNAALGLEGALMHSGQRELDDAVSAAQNASCPLAGSSGN